MSKLKRLGQVEIVIFTLVFLYALPLEASRQVSSYPSYPAKYINHEHRESLFDSERYSALVNQYLVSSEINDKGSYYCDALGKGMFPDIAMWPYDIKKFNRTVNLEWAKTVLSGDVQPDKLNCVITGHHSLLRQAVKAYESHRIFSPENREAKALMELLLKKGADPNYTEDLPGRTLLFRGLKQMSFGNTELADMLIAYGADVDTKFFGRTLLSLAVDTKSMHLVFREFTEEKYQLNTYEYLVKNGADVYAIVYDDVDVLSYARKILEKEHGVERLRQVFGKEYVSRSEYDKKEQAKKALQKKLEQCLVKEGYYWSEPRDPELMQKCQSEVQPKQSKPKG